MRWALLAAFMLLDAVPAHADIAQFCATHPIFDGCPFDLADAHPNPNYSIQALPATTQQVLLSDWNALHQFCADPADQVFSAYSPYDTGYLYFIRKGTLVETVPADRAYIHDLQDRNNRWQQRTRGCPR